MRVVFMGSPAFALPSLRALITHYEVLAVVTQPDRPAGRGRRIRPPEVKQLAIDASIPVYQPAKLRDPAVIHHLGEWHPEIIVVAAFGQLIPSAILELPDHGCLNVHPSLLPRWRGASPVQAAILHGDAETGVTIMKLNAGLDMGPIVAQRRVLIGEETTGGELSNRLAELGAALLIDTLPGYVAGEVRLVEQDETQATVATAIRKTAGEIDFTKTAAQLARQVRAYEPWPASFLRWEGRRLIVRRARLLTATRGAPGEVLMIDGFPAVATADGLLLLETVQPEGKGVMDGRSFARGAPSFIGTTLTANSMA